MMECNVKANSFKAWVLAARPKTLAAASVPVIIGSALAVGDGKFSFVPFALCLLFAFIMQVAANFINDLYDYRKGSDREDRLGPERACAQGWITPGAMLRGIFAAVVLACVCGVWCAWTPQRAPAQSVLRAPMRSAPLLRLLPAQAAPSDHPSMVLLYFQSRQTAGIIHDAPGIFPVNHRYYSILPSDLHGRIWTACEHSVNPAPKKAC